MAQKNRNKRTETWPAAERRVIGRFLDCWESLRGVRAFPTRGDIDRWNFGELRPHLFLVDVCGGLEAATFISCGEVLSAACRRDPTGESVSDSLPGVLWETLPYAFQAVIKTRKPLISKRPALTARGAVFPYRCAIAPAGASAERVEYLLGAFSHGNPR